jgi:hypothetical protein
MWQLSYDPAMLRSPPTAALVAAVVFALVSKLLGALTQTPVAWARLAQPAAVAGAACAFVVHLGQSSVNRAILTDTFD